MQLGLSERCLDAFGKKLPFRFRALRICTEGILVSLYIYLIIRSCIFVLGSALGPHYQTVHALLHTLPGLETRWPAVALIDIARQKGPFEWPSEGQRAHEGIP